MLAWKLETVVLEMLLTTNSPDVRTNRLKDREDHHGQLNVEGRRGIRLKARASKRSRERFTWNIRTQGQEERVVVEVADGGVDVAADGERERGHGHAERGGIFEPVGRRLPAI